VNSAASRSSLPRWSVSPEKRFVDAHARRSSCSVAVEPATIMPWSSPALALVLRQFGTAPIAHSGPLPLPVWATSSSVRLRKGSQKTPCASFPRWLLHSCATFSLLGLIALCNITVEMTTTRRLEEAMGRSAKPRRPKTETELREAESNIENLKQELALYEGNEAARNLIANWLRQQEQKAAKRRQELARADAFAARLRQLREERKLTQDELAKRASVAQATISLLEQGDRQPSWPTVCRLATALDIRVEAFQHR
jgi:DNA-binding XRE family transcriptional regulator